MNYSGIIKADFANGLGVRVTLFVSGCNMNCPECHSPELWNYHNGLPFDDAAKEEIMSYLKNEWVSGITLSGGHPLDPHNIKDVFALIKEIKERFPEKTIWLYTGYTLTLDHFSLKSESLLCKTITMCDVIVDGVYDKSLRDTSLPFRGSSNQLIIDVKRTIESGSIKEFEIE